METLFLLLILTQNAAGDINAAFVNTQSLHQCQQKALMIEAVFRASDIPVIERRCIESHLQFSQFGHAATSRNARYFYLIEFDEDTVQITAVPDWLTCIKQQQSSVTQGRLYCSSSVQYML